MDLNEVDLNLLVAFDALLAERSVTKAAARLCIGQSAMSSTLGRLRKVFDDEVLVRDGRRLVPTPLAESLVKPVREVLDDIQAIFSGLAQFDPATAERTFMVVASDYTMLTLLTPLISRLEVEAPGVRLWVSPPGDDDAERLRGGRADLMIIPREVFATVDEHPNTFLFEERFVCAVDAENDRVGDTITLEEFSSLPYLATSCGHEISPVEAQLDRLGVRRSTEMTTAFGLAPMLLRGTRRIALIHERLARSMREQAGIRLLDPPMPLEPINQMMVWTTRVDSDPGHQWLRSRVLAVANEQSEHA